MPPADALDDATAMDAANVDASTPEAPATDVFLDAPTGDPLSWDVRRAGPFNVGYRTFTTSYVAPGATVPRMLTIHVWYPTLATAGRHPRYASLFTDPDAIVDAPLARTPYSSGRYPLQAFSHGHRGYAGNAAFMMRYFASHGWIAAGPDHLGNTLDNSPEPRPINLYYLRALDMTATLDGLARLPAADALAGLVDTTRVLLTGHSFGTHTVWSAAGATFDVDAISARCVPAGSCTPADLAAFRAGTREARFVAAIPMAGTIGREWFGPTGHTSVTLPMFAMSGTADPVGADVQWMTTAPMPMTWIDIRGACHQFFGFGGCMGIADALQPVIVGTYALALGRRTVLNDTNAAVAAILEGRQVLSDTVTFLRR